jgi:hypothetical protein
MKKTYLNTILISMFLFFLIGAGLAFGWHDKTHLAISQAAGYESWYNSAGPDITKVKAGETEATNHWFNNTAGVTVTDKMVLNQAMNYNNPNDREGHLYGAIIATLRSYIAAKGDEKPAGYPMAFCAHYIGDLSMPFHNSPYNDYNALHHKENDSTIESVVMNDVGFIQSRIYDIDIKCEEDVAREIAKIANTSRTLAAKLEKEGKNMTSEQTYDQIIQSASLLKAVLKYAAVIIRSQAGGCK